MVKSASQASLNSSQSQAKDQQLAQSSQHDLSKRQSVKSVIESCNQHNSMDIVDDINDADDDEDSAYETEEDVADDNSTFLEAAKNQSQAERNEELCLLEADQSIPIEEIRRRYAEMPDEDMDIDDEDDAAVVDEGKDIHANNYNNEEFCTDEDDSDYEIEDEESDDEETFLEAERSESATDRKHELQLLEEEQEVPIEELRARYASMEDYDDDYDDDEDKSNESYEQVNESAPIVEESKSSSLSMKDLVLGEKIIIAIRYEFISRRSQ
jgi:hypothetical protein